MRQKLIIFFLLLNFQLYGQKILKEYTIKLERIGSRIGSPLQSHDERYIAFMNYGAFLGKSFIIVIDTYNNGVEKVNMAGKQFYFTKDSKYLLVGDNNILTMIDLSTGTTVNEVKIQKEFMFVDEEIVQYYDNGSQYFYDWRKEQIINSIKTNEKNLGIVSPNKKYMITRRGNGVLRLWDLNTKENVFTFYLEKEQGIPMFSQDSFFLNAITKNNILKKWSVEIGNEVNSIKLQVPPDFLSYNEYTLSLSPNGTLGLLCSNDYVNKKRVNTTTIINMFDGNTLATVNKVNEIGKPNFSGDGSKIIMANSEAVDLGKIKILDISDLKTKTQHYTLLNNTTIPKEEKPQIDISLKRFALIIGNSNYKYGNELNGIPVNDAHDIAAKLEELNFQVTILTDATKSQIDNTITNFMKKASNSEVALFYYAGHGIEIKEKNYLLPIDANPKNSDDINKVAVELDFILNQLKNLKAKTNLVYLDACRNNPFRNWNRGQGGGLKEVNIELPTMKIYFATQPGETAQNGIYRNGIFTTSLLKFLQKGVEIESLMQKVTQDVYKKTNGSQIPWSSGVLMNSFEF